MDITIREALLSLRPGAQWACRGGVYEGIEWCDTIQTKPTKIEVEAEIERLQTEYEYNEYQRQRAQEYPSFAEQFDILYHGGYDAWKAEIDKIKDKYPKPE